MKKFIVIQTVVISDIVKERNGTFGNTIELANIVRQINAETKEEAVGRFILNTRDVYATGIKKMDVECYELETLKSI